MELNKQNIWSQLSRINNENPDASTDNFKISLAGLNSVLDVYAKGKGVKKDKYLTNLVELRKKGELETWLKEQMAEPK